MTLLQNILVVTGLTRALLFAVGVVWCSSRRDVLGMIGFSILAFTATVFTFLNAGLPVDASLVRFSQVVSTPGAAIVVAAYIRASCVRETDAS